MKTLKNIAYGASSAVLLLPAVAFAQWNVGRNNAAGSGLPDQSIYGIINNIMNWLLGILGFIAIIGFVISGILYLTAAGDEGRIEKAKEAMTWSIVGVIVALIGFVIVRAAEGLLGANRTF